mmetsp:Transcript_86506/g.249851  ORF Transcript_86506/g.249851 Transcript_86506/m.249851 type:complete len:94 (+) Transcript_86506:585-866(+)
MCNVDWRRNGARRKINNNLTARGREKKMQQHQHLPRLSKEYRSSHVILARCKLPGNDPGGLCRPTWKQKQPSGMKLDRRQRRYWPAYFDQERP